MNLRYIDGNSILLVMVGNDNISMRTDCSVLLFSDLDWNVDLSPWPADTVFAKGEGFAGKADQLLATLVNEEHIRSDRYKRKIIAGYSMAGLFALYACVKSTCFDGCVCCSGSLWYPGFVSWLQGKDVNCRYVYLSLGKKEKKSRNHVLAGIETCTQSVYRYLNRNHLCTLVFNEGNHFTDIDGRLSEGITWMKKMIDEDIENEHLSCF